MTTINALSLPSFTKFLDDIIQLRIDFNELGFMNRTPVSFNYLRFPPHLQVTILPDYIRSKYAKEIVEFVQEWDEFNIKSEHAKFYLEEIDQVKRFCDYMIKDTTSGPKYRENFMQFIQHYDVRRKKDFVKTFPEYEEMYEEWQELYGDKLNSDLKDLIDIVEIT